ncbi:hypothetical protein BHM03_00056538 [Ensete ventricosum]|nr:hypothetical protein BHM03_00056538 [Ensete ventricosum]
MDLRRPTDPNPVWIPTKAITLCRSGVPLPAAPPRSHTTETDLGSRPGQLRAGLEMEMAPKRNPARPKIRQKREKAEEEEEEEEEEMRRKRESRGEGSGPARKTLGDFGIARFDS